MIETYYRILKHNSKGKLVKDSGLIHCHSYVIQFLEMLRGALLNNVASVNATDVDGAETLIWYNSGAIQGSGRINALAGDDTYGIVVGTNAGSTPENNENYELDTKIIHSAVGAAGQLNYQAVTMLTARVVGANIDLDVSRAFLNETGSTITVKEIGLQSEQTSGPSKYHLLLRDVVTDEDVLNGFTLTVIYTLRTTV